MAGSALLGYPPATQEDVDIIRGFYEVQGMPAIQAADAMPIIPVLAPPGAPHDTRSGTLIAAMCVVIPLVFIITGTRLSLRCFRRDLRWGLDDWVIILGVMGVFGWTGLVIGVAKDGGGGKHMWDLTYRELNIFISLNGIGQPVFYVALGLIKISITLFNRRLTGLTSRKWMIFHNTMLVLLVCYILAAIFANIFSCNPAALNFRLSVLGQSKAPPKCVNNNHVTLPLSILHIVFDFALLSVPIIVLYQMQMSVPKKIRICILFSVGAISCIGSLVRQHQQMIKHLDMTYQYPDVEKWVIVDMFFAITAASLPILNSLLPSHWGSRPNSNLTPITPISASNAPWHGHVGAPFKLDSTSTIHEPNLNEVAFHSDDILNDEEKGQVKASPN